jgi:hypothetical protein
MWERDRDGGSLLLDGSDVPDGLRCRTVSSASMDSSRGRVGTSFVVTTQHTAAAAAVGVTSKSTPPSNPFADEDDDGGDDWEPSPSPSPVPSLTSISLSAAPAPPPPPPLQSTQTGRYHGVFAPSSALAAPAPAVASVPSVGSPVSEGSQKRPSFGFASSSSATSSSSSSVSARDRIMEVRKELGLRAGPDSARPSPSSGTKLGEVLTGFKSIFMKNT